MVIHLISEKGGPQIPRVGVLCSWGSFTSWGVKFKVAPDDFDSALKKDAGKDKGLGNQWGHTGHLVF